MASTPTMDPLGATGCVKKVVVPVLSSSSETLVEVHDQPRSTETADDVVMDESRPSSTVRLRRKLSDEDEEVGPG